MAQVAGAFDRHDLGRVLAGVLFKGLTANRRAEVVPRAFVFDLLFGGGWVDAHSAHRVSDESRSGLRSARVSSKHFDSAGRNEPPSQHGHQDQKSDVEE